ncbi:hypothetical protein M1O53_02970 [Dehalococcoidia bacterium]|nr:hypothetical protein [Dehalococcoidia bacterium]
MFKKIINRLHRNERGITGLETAIILIAFVVVASVFAYTVLSAGLFSAQQADETVRSGIRTTQTTMKLRGGILAHATNITADGNTTNAYVERISFTVSNVLGEGQAIDLTPTHDVTAEGLLGTPVGNLTPPLRSVTIISFDDANIVIPEVAWTVEFGGGYEDDGDFLLEDVERATITVWLAGTHTGNYTGLTTNAIFNIQVMPPQGATLLIQERTPAFLRPIMRL